MSFMGDSTAEPPDDEFQDWDDLDSTFSDQDEFSIGQALTNNQECENQEEKKEESEDEVQKNVEANLVAEELEVPRKLPCRRRWRPPRRNPLGMAGFTCQVLLPVWCAMVAADTEANHFESADLEMLQHVAGREPGKTVVPPGEVQTSGRTKPRCVDPCRPGRARLIFA